MGRKKTFIERPSADISWCDGCSYFVLLDILAKAIEKFGKEKYGSDYSREGILKEFVAFSGIGCSGRIAGYLNFKQTAHCEHGRALPSATAFSLVSDLDNMVNGKEPYVLVFMGDGDGGAIGGNHLIHAARRNVDVVAFEMNNRGYSMTGYQPGPTTPMGNVRDYDPFGKISEDLDLAKLVMDGCEAPYVARGVLAGGYLDQAEEIIIHAIKNPGFSFVEFISHCPRHVKSEKGKGKMKANEFKELCNERCMPIEESQKGLSYNEIVKQIGGKIPIGILRDDTSRESYNQGYLKVVEKVQKPPVVAVKEFLQGKK